MTNIHRTEQPCLLGGVGAPLRFCHSSVYLARAFDIATASCEIGAILWLDGTWQGLERIRILMGDDGSKRTSQAFEQGLREIVRILDDRPEAEKEENDFLTGAPAMRL